MIVYNLAIWVLRIDDKKGLKLINYFIIWGDFYEKSPFKFDTIIDSKVQLGVIRMLVYKNTIIEYRSYVRGNYE